MAKLSDKYIAGFLDSDGSIELVWSKVDRANTNPAIGRGYVALRFTQLTKQDEVLFRIQEAIGGNIYYSERGNGSTLLALVGTKAQMVLSRIAKHLVVKRHYAYAVLELHGQALDKDSTKQHLKEQRRIKSLPIPNFPPRKWLAGYFDGDGHIGIRVPANRRSAQPVFEIASSDYDTEGLEVIQKVFGGTIHDIGKRPVKALTITMPPSKAKQMLGYFTKHLITKREQAEFILSCAEMGHYRDGISIKSAIKQLKAHPHRLNEPRPKASDLFKDVKDVSLESTCYGRNYWPGGRSKAHLAKRQSDMI